MAVTRPLPDDLWKEAEGDSARYRQLLIQHEYIVTDPRCHECSQKRSSRIHHDPKLEGAHHFKPELKAQDPALQLAYLEMDVEEANAHWEMSRGNTLSFEALIRHAATHEFKVLGGPEVEAAYAQGKKGGYGFEITNKVTGQKTTGIMCSHSHPGEREPRCQVCQTRAGAYLCDYPTGEPCAKCKGSGRHPGLHVCRDCSGTGKGTCSKRLCTKCRTRGKGKDEDYCPEHREQTGQGPAPIKRETCHWAYAPAIVNRKCARQSCAAMIDAEMRVLFFPRRARAMCAACGEEYLKVSK